jgi:hypothetical protein
MESCSIGSANNRAAHRRAAFDLQEQVMLTREISIKKIVLTLIRVDGRNGCVGKSVIDLWRDEG